MNSVELFTGAGGLGMGVSRAGFDHLALVEYDRWCCDTIQENRRRRIHPVAKWPEVEPRDVRDFDFSATLPSDIDLLAGGPPCQPFSLGGKHRSHQDKRDMFPEIIRAMRETRPRAIMIENVKGLLRKPFTNYVTYIWLQMSYPTVEIRLGEDWVAHLGRLQQYHTGRHEPGYKVVYQLLNAADYGVPQKRERVIFVGFRSDLDANWSFDANVPTTHSRDSLLSDQWVTGDYWKRHGLRAPRSNLSTSQLDRLAGRALDDSLPWKTVRDAIHDLPNPRDRHDVPDHHARPGARSYPGHTGSPLDEPAKTLKAGDHGVPGGENMLRHPNGSVRYFTVRESARLQCFPDDYVFHGSWSEIMRQLGNAVPVTLGEVVARSIADHLGRLNTKNGR